MGGVKKAHSAAFGLRRDMPKRKRPPTGAAFRHIASGGSMSGAEGLRSGWAPGLSTCCLRSAALSNSAADILGSLVNLANFKRIVA